MNEKFLSMDSEKKDRILNAALKEFSQKGYQHASTNEMVKEAGISKGLLFHYFSNKKTLYLFLYDHFMNLLMKEIHKKVDWNEQDIFERYRDIGILKFELFKKYPDIFNFAMTVSKEDSADVKSEIENRQKELLDSGYKDLFSDIDFSKFKDGLDIQRTVQIIYWTLEGFAYSWQDKITPFHLDELNIDELMEEMDRYCEILRNAFYK